MGDISAKTHTQLMRAHIAVGSIGLNRSQRWCSSAAKVDANKSTPLKLKHRVPKVSTAAGFTEHTQPISIGVAISAAAAQ